MLYPAELRGLTISDLIRSPIPGENVIALRVGGRNSGDSTSRPQDRREAEDRAGPDMRRRHQVRCRLAIGVVVGLAAPAGTSGAVAGSADCALPVTRTVDATAAIDGDTIETDQGVMVRLAGIEAPKPSGFGDSSIAGAARDALGGLVAGNRLSLATTGAAADRYGRVHAQVFLADGTWLQAAQVNGGWARIRPLAGETGCISALLSAEDAARRAGRGIWAAAILTL